MILRQYIRACLTEWHEHLDTVMAPSPDTEPEYEDEEELAAEYPKNNRNPKDPYGGSFESRGKRPKALATSRAMAHTAASTGFGSGPMSGRRPGGNTQGFTRTM